ncbi:hypothetical protein [Haladaptatus sp. ZSTT2]|uniref:hypothetical protein n=1 Tax=Haladaptatus sp. ZSTT2 TaxID=3120515 RepID=UPI00300F52BA
MALNWSRIGRILLVLCIALLVVPSGVALADGDGHGDDHTETASHAGEDGHDSSGIMGSWYALVGGLFLLGSVVTVPAYRRMDAHAATNISRAHHAGALLAVFSAAVHLYLFLEHGTLVMLLAGVGFLGGIGLFFAGVNRRALYLAGIVFTALQIPLWILEGMPHLQNFGLLDKVAQVTLIAVLGYLTITETR